MKILTLHRILDFNHILVRVAGSGWSEDSQQSDLTVQRACEKGSQHGQDGDVQEGTHGNHRRGSVYGCMKERKEERKEEEEKRKRRGRMRLLSSAQLGPGNSPFRK